MQTLAVGVIGCGNISSTYLELAPLFRGIAIKAVADIDPHAATARASEFGVEARTVDALLTADDIDIIVNLTIPDAHYPVSRRILENGKHVWSEKPFVLSLQEGLELQSLATTRGLRIGSAPDTFLGGAHQAARTLLDEGQLGRVVGGSCHFMNAGMEDWHPNPDFFFQPGGGPVLDMGPYYLSNLVQLLGPVKAVSAMCNTAFAARIIANGPREGESVPVNTPTSYHALLEFDNGGIVTLSTSWDVRSHRHGIMEIYGTQGTLYVPDPNFFGGSVQFSPHGDEIHDIDDAGHPFGIANTQDNHERKRANYRCAGLADMADGILNDRPHRCSPDLALHVVDTLLSIQSSAESRQWQTLSTHCQQPAALSPDEARALLLA